MKAIVPIKTIITGACCLFVLVVAANGAEGPNDRSMRDEVEILTSLPHGFHRLSPDRRAKLETLMVKVTANPVEYLPVIENVMQNQILQSNWKGLEQAASLLGKMRDSDSKALLTKIIVVLDQLLKKEQDPMSARNIRATLLVLLGNLGDYGNELVFGVVIAHLQEKNLQTFIPLKLYLSKSAVGNEDVGKQLQALVEEKKSPLYDDSNIKDLIDNIRRKSRQ